MGVAVGEALARALVKRVIRRACEVVGEGTSAVAAGGGDVLPRGEDSREGEVSERGDCAPYDPQEGTSAQHAGPNWEVGDYEINATDTCRILGETLDQLDVLQYLFEKGQVDRVRKRIVRVRSSILREERRTRDPSPRKGLMGKIRKFFRRK